MWFVGCVVAGFYGKMNCWLWFPYISIILNCASIEHVSMCVCVCVCYCVVSLCSVFGCGCIDGPIDNFVRGSKFVVASWLFCLNGFEQICALSIERYLLNNCWNTIGYIEILITIYLNQMSAKVSLIEWKAKFEESKYLTYEPMKFLRLAATIFVKCVCLYVLIWTIFWGFVWNIFYVIVYRKYMCIFLNI